MMEEQNCIEKIKNGDTQAYRELVERFQTGLIIHCENILKNRQDAEDVAQDAFVTAFNKLANFDETKARFSTWLYRIATNACIDLLRRNKRKVHIKDIESYLDTTLPEHIEQDEIEMIRQAVETLEPPKYAAIIKAYFWEGKSYQEIAADYGTSSNTVGTWISRAKLQLRGKLA